MGSQEIPGVRGKFGFGVQSLPSCVGSLELSREISRKNEETDPKLKQNPVVDVNGNGSKL